LNCTSCNANIPAAAKFCPQCGAEVVASQQCSNCGEALKPSAKFCHNCGAPVAGEASPKTSKATPLRETVPAKSNRAVTIASFVAIPAFAILIIALLFWKNQDPEPLSVSGGGAQEQGMPSMAAMQSVHETLQRLQKRLEADAHDVVAMDSLAAMYSIAGSYEKASQYYLRHLEIEPDNLDVKMMLAHSYFQLQRLDDAMKLVQSVLKKEPTNALALFNLGVIYSSQGKQKEATQHLQIIIDTYPGTEWASRAQQLIHELEHTD
jgi:cytochrome c-type biogenesis protein CcmH/NrfG/predicted RNA-binding Zn-ribbon protein involved in translation (DUF1610 family)